MTVVFLDWNVKWISSTSFAKVNSGKEIACMIYYVREPCFIQFCIS